MGRYDNGKFYMYTPQGNTIRNDPFLDEIQEAVKTAATSEDTEPVGKDVGFLQEPKKELYPCLFQGTKDIPSDTIATLKNHVVEPLSERFTNPDAWIMFSIYGSGISYN